MITTSRTITFALAPQFVLPLAVMTDEAIAAALAYVETQVGKIPPSFYTDFPAFDITDTETGEVIAGG